MKENVDTSMLHDAMVPRFWRDDAFPFIETRAVHDGSNVCYAKHTHETFSIGVITQGACTYINERLRAIEAGFSDQAHLQRVFRQFMAATPGQYRRRT